MTSHTVWYLCQGIDFSFKIRRKTTYRLGVLSSRFVYGRINFDFGDYRKALVSSQGEMKIRVDF